MIDRRTVLRGAFAAVAAPTVIRRARAELERSKDTLAEDIAEAVLAGGPSAPGGSRGKGTR